MKPLGIVRKVDHLGRIVIPSEFRKAMDWPNGTPIEMFATSQGLFIRSYEPGVETPESNEIKAVQL